MLRRIQYHGHLATAYHRRIKRRRLLEVFTAFLYCSLIGLMLCMGMVIHQLGAERDAVAERYKVNGELRQLQQILISLQDAETGQRGYLLTGKPRYLGPYEKVSQELPQMIAALAAKYPNDFDISPGMQTLSSLVKTKLAELAETIRLHNANQHAQALQLVLTDNGQAATEQARAAISAVSDVLRMRRDSADARVLQGTSNVRTWTVLMLFAFVGCVTLVSIQLRRNSQSRRRYEEQLAAQSATLNAVVDEIPAIVAIVDRNLVYQLVNKAYENWRRRSRTAVLGKPVLQVAGEQEYQHALPFLQRALRGETVEYEREYEGEFRYVSLTYTPLFLEGGEVGGVIVLINDLTDMRMEQERLTHLSQRDSLTGALNRAGFEAYLSDEIEAGRAETLAILYIDLDHFKPVNDQHGHAAGDEVLRAFVLRLQQQVRPADIIGRLGGDEFAVALSGVRNFETAQRIAEDIIAAARQPFVVANNTLQIGASVGIALNASDGWQALLARADKMVYEAKAKGRGRANLYAVRG